MKEENDRYYSSVCDFRPFAEDNTVITTTTDPILVKECLSKSKSKTGGSAES